MESVEPLRIQSLADLVSLTNVDDAKIKSKQLGALNSMVNNAPVDNVTPPSFNSDAALQAKGWVMARFETLKRSKDPDRLKKLASWLLTSKARCNATRFTKRSRHSSSDSILLE